MQNHQNKYELMEVTYVKEPIADTHNYKLYHPKSHRSKENAKDIPYKKEEPQPPRDSELHFNKYLKHYHPKPEATFVPRNALGTCKEVENSFTSTFGARHLNPDPFNVYNNNKDDPEKNIVLKCQYCPFYTDQSYNLISHLRIHNTEIQQQFENYPRPGTVPAAVPEVAPPLPPPPPANRMHSTKETFECSDCSYHTTTDNYNLQNHLRFYTGEKLFKCGDCTFDTKPPTNCNNIKTNGTGIHDVDQKPYRCADCAYSTIRSSDLKTHAKVHSDEKTFKCVICAYSTKHSSALRVHLRIHTGEKPFRCTDCSYSTARSSDLKTHSRVHVLEKSFKCVICSYSTKHSSALRVHLRIHTGEKPFRCMDCPYSTARSSDLTKHSRIHNGEKSFKCLICSYSTKHSSALRVHLRIHTGELNHRNQRK